MPGPNSHRPTRFDATALPVVPLERLQDRARVPLTTIKIAAELLMGDALHPAERLEHLRAIQRSSRRLLGLVDDVAELERLQTGEHTPGSEPVPVFAVLEEVLTVMRFRAERKGLRLITQVDWPFPEVVRSKTTALRRILTEVLGNAVHYTERGEITLRCRLVRTGETAALAFQIEDSGQGMHPHELARVFKPFERGAERAQLAGEGLGLVMAQHLAESLGGELRANSQVGVGTTIDVRIAAGATEDLVILDREPLHVDIGQSLPPQQPGPLAGTALLIEPDPDLRRALARLLERDGLKVTAVGTGVEALERIFPRRERRAEPAEPGGRCSSYDIVLLEGSLNDRSGESIAAGLRTRGYKGKIIGLSADPLDTRRARFLDVGCDAVIEKPIDSALLRFTLEQLLPGNLGLGAA